LNSEHAAMQTIQVVRFGDPGVLEAVEAPEPVAGPGEALVAVEVADVLTLDAALRAGQGTDFFDLRPPYVPGGGVAGRVLATGSAADAGWVGRRVVARLGQAGACAERAVAGVETLVPIPEDLSSVDAAALVHDGLTARGLLEAADVRAGERVLVTAAAGAMGVLLLQDLVRAGATVVGAIRGEAKAAVVRALGAAAVAYDVPGWPEAAVEAAAGRFDVVLDGVGGDVGRAAFGVIADGGRFSAHGAPSGDFAPVEPQEAASRGIVLRTIRDLWFAPEEAAPLLAGALGDAAAGHLRPAVIRPLPLRRAADAHRVVDERRTAGKTVLLVERPAGLRPSVAIAAEVLSWDGTDAAWGRDGEHVLWHGDRELGHLHGDELAHVGASPAHPGPRTEAAYDLTGDDAVRQVVAGLRRSYDGERSPAAA
jgi:NADPH2:quinone reductase